MEKDFAANPTNFQKAFDLAIRYIQIQQNDRAGQILDGILNNPKADANVIFAVAQIYAQVNNLPKLEVTLQKLVKMIPDQPEAWYNLAATKAGLGKSSEAVQDLRQALELNAKRAAQDPKAHDLRPEAEKDTRFNSIRDLPEYKALITPK